MCLRVHTSHTHGSCVACGHAWCHTRIVHMSAAHACLTRCTVTRQCVTHTCSHVRDMLFAYYRHVRIHPSPTHNHPLHPALTRKFPSHMRVSCVACGHISASHAFSHVYDMLLACRMRVGASVRRPHTTTHPAPSSHASFRCPRVFHVLYIDILACQTHVRPYIHDTLGFDVFYVNLSACHTRVSCCYHVTRVFACL